MASTLVSVLGAALSGGAAGFVYMGFVARRLDVAMGVRGMLAGLAAMAAGGPFIPPAYAVLVGLVAGVLACLGTYLLERLRLPDRTGLVTAYGLGGLWGLLAVGLFADGTYGAGWNGVGAQTYLETTGQGVTGYWPAAGMVSDPTQINAQLAGIVAAVAVVFVGSLLVCRMLNRLGWLRGRSGEMQGQGER
jgi:Amt family ammonium transporter